MLRGSAVAAVYDYMHEQTGEDVTNWNPHVCRWARSRLPMGQIARSFWKEKMKPLEKLHISCNIRVSPSDPLTFLALTFAIVRSRPYHVLWRNTILFSSDHK
jgi:hypothetical protein